MSTTTTTPTATELAGAIQAEIDRLLVELDDQVVVSQNRWVDHLLDLYNLVGTDDLRREVARTLAEIRTVRSVEACFLYERLLALVAAVAVESALDDLLLSRPG